MKKAIYPLILLLSGALLAQDAAVDNISEGVTEAPAGTSELQLEGLVNDVPAEATSSSDLASSTSAPDKKDSAKRKIEKKKVTKITKPKPKVKPKAKDELKVTELNQPKLKVIKNVKDVNVQLIHELNDVAAVDAKPVKANDKVIKGIIRKIKDSNPNANIIVQDVAVSADGAILEVPPKPVKTVVAKRKGGVSHIIISDDNPNVVKGKNNKAKVVSSSVRKKKVPILGDIPVVGELFSSTEKVVETKEIPVRTVNSGTVLLTGTDKDGVSVVTEMIVDGKKGKVPVKTIRKGKKVVNPYTGEVIITGDGKEAVSIAQVDPDGNIVVLTADEVTLTGSGALPADRKKAVEAMRAAKRKIGGMRVGSVDYSYGDPMASNQDNRDQRIANLEKKVAQLLKELEHLRKATRTSSQSRRNSASTPVAPRPSGTIRRSSTSRRTARTLPPGMGTTSAQPNPFGTPKPPKPLNPPKLPGASSGSPFAPAVPDAFPGTQPGQPRAVTPQYNAPRPTKKTLRRSYYGGDAVPAEPDTKPTPGARSGNDAGNSRSRYYYNYKGVKPPQTSANPSRSRRSSTSSNKPNPYYWSYSQPSTGASPEPQRMRTYGSTSSSRKGSNEAVLTELSRLRGEMAQIRKLLERALSR